MATRLPEELYNEILNNVYDCHDTLKSCALAARVLATPAQKHLFSRILIRGPYRIILAGVEPDRGCSSTQLKNLLQDSPHIAPYIRSLKIQDRTKRYINTLHEGSQYKIYYEVEATNNSHEWISKDTDLVDALAPLNRVRDFWLEYRAARYDDRDSQISPAINFSIQRIMQLTSLEHLTLRDSFTPLIKPSDNLKELFIESTRPRTVPNLSFMSLLPSLQIFKLRGVVKTSLHQVLLQYSPVRIRNLQLHADNSCLQYLSLYTKFIDSCKATLEHLTILLPSSFRYQDPFLDLQSLRALKSVCIQLSSGADPRDPIQWSMDQVRWTTNVLKTSLSPTSFLEKIEIAFIVLTGYTDEWTNLQWYPLSDILLGGGFPQLKTVIWRPVFVDRAHQHNLIMMEGFVDDLKSHSFVQALQQLGQINVLVEWRAYQAPDMIIDRV